MNPTKLLWPCGGYVAAGRLLVVSWVGAAAVAGLVSGCSSKSSVTSTSTSSATSSVTPTADPHALAVKACATFNEVEHTLGTAQIALEKDDQNTPHDQAMNDMKAVLTGARNAASRMRTVLTPDVPNPPAAALRAWVDSLGTMLNSDANAGPNDPNDFSTNEEKEVSADSAANDACKPFD
jgi:hypothetical protein